MFRVAFIVLFFHLSCAAKHQTLNLQLALDKKLVIAKVYSLGGFQGYCMNMEIKNIGKDSLIVLIEPGWRLNSINGKSQDILIVKQEIVTLKSGEEKVVSVKGYCCQSSHVVPLKYDVYRVSKFADSNLVKLARYLNNNKFEEAVEQQAVWAISDGKSTAKIASGKNAIVDSLRYFVAAIKQEKLPWYTLVSYTHVYANGIISVFPLWLKGTLNYSSDEACYVILSVLNEKGFPVCLVKSEWLKASDNGRYELKIPVKGLAKGKYTVELTSQKEQLVKKEFEL